MNQETVQLYLDLKPVPLTADETLAQSLSVTRATYVMSLSQKRLLVAAMQALHISGNPDLSVVINAGDVIKAFGLSDGGVYYNQFRRVASTMQALVVRIPNLTYKGIKEEGFINWFSGTYLRENGDIRFTFHEKLAPVLRELKSHFTLLPLIDLGKLESIYSIRIYELVMSNSGFAGKYGNPPGKWWYTATIEELRDLLGVGTEKYKNNTSEFKRNILDRPIKEINAANIGINISYESQRAKRQVIGIKFYITYIEKNNTVSGKEWESSTGEKTRIINANKERYSEILEKIKKEKPDQGPIQTEFDAYIQLRTELKRAE